MTRLGLCAVLALGVSSASSEARNLSFEDRVNAQEAIERVYYSHQIGATKAFEEAVPRAVLEAKVRRYLDETAALTVQWKTAVTDEALQRELERMALGTRMPERLQELYAALGNDPFLVKECLARPILVDRLIHNFYAFDPRFHADARARAEALRHRLVTREVSPLAVHPNRTVSELIASIGRTVPAPTEHVLKMPLTPEEFRTRRAELPVTTGQVSEVRETRDGFEFNVVLSETTTDLRVASYAIPKITWDGWWIRARRAYRLDDVQAVARYGESLPLPSGTRSPMASESCRDDYWDNSISDSLSVSAGYTAVWTGSQMLIWGGATNGNTLVNTGARYDPSTDSWTSISVAGAPSARSSHSAVWTGTSMVVWGGNVNTGGRYDPTTDTWMPTSTTSAPSARVGHSAVWTGNVMVVWGGRDVGGGVVDSGGRYDPTNDVWTPMSSLSAPLARELHTAVWTGNVMVVWGGSNGAGLNTGGRYDPVSDTWTPMATMAAPSGRYSHSAVWTGSLMMVWGGYTSVANSFQYFQTGGRYDPVTDSWTPTSVTGAPSARYSHTGVWTGSSMVIWGGSDCCSRFNNGGRYNPVTNTWTPTDTIGAPAARLGHSAIWTGSRMVVWGGLQADLQPTGGRYDPLTDTWTPMAGSNAPGPRQAHTAVWTGSLMVVWGGAYFSALNTGGRYDPATDSWSPTTVAQAPYGRYAHVAVWTGSRMIVWGGGNFDTYWDAGGKYDPVADQWTPITSVLAPPKTGWGTAVWTGSRMIVWGGGNQHTGWAGGSGRYDPVADQWMEVSTNGAPVPRSDHTAVWTGNRMVVWGGYSLFDNFVVNSGGLYDPVADTWTATSSVGAPSARRFHVGVWTGNRMVVWGGDNGSSPSFKTGGRYDPGTNTWMPTSTVDAPDGFSYGTAVWTGSRALIWGGSGGGPDQSRGIGGRYDPATDSWSPITSVDAPSTRSSFTSVWAGSMMLVWGGYLPTTQSVSGSGGRYLTGGSNDNDGDGFSRCEGDCNDQSAAVKPGGSETCNGVDDNCDGIVDNGGDALCNDEDACTIDNCHAAGGCVFTFCRDDNPCTDDVCDAGVGCLFTNNASACNDGNACTNGDFCQGGSCLPGLGSVNCDDGNVCTTDYCNPTAGCVHPTNTNSCDDGNPCTVGDACGGGSCNGTPVVCADSNACTDDSCNPATGVCEFTSDDTNTCSDANPCTQVDVCQSGTCIGSNPVQCTGGCPPGFTQAGALCQKTYDIGVSLLDNLGSFCDGTGTNRYNNCGFLSYGFHWTDLGNNLGAVTRVDVQLETGISCGSPPSSVRLNGSPSGSFSRVGSCGCNSTHATVSLPNLPAGVYVMGGNNAISIAPGANCEGLSRSASLGNNYARVTVTYAPHDNPCQAGVCEPATGVCNFSNLADGTACSDGNACTVGDACSGGSCAGTVVAAPSEVTGVTLAKSGSDAVISWTPAAGATTSVVLRGDIASLPVGPGGGDEVCLGSTGATSMPDTDVLVPGAGTWYLVRGSNACAGSGPYGFEGLQGVPAAPRTSASCP